MSNIRITIDGNTVMNSDPGQWSTTPPDISTLVPNLGTGQATTPQPWMQAIMHELARTAVITAAGKDAGNTTMTVTTRPGGWTLEVDQK